MGYLVGPLLELMLKNIKIDSDLKIILQYYDEIGGGELITKMHSDLIIYNSILGWLFVGGERVVCKHSKERMLTTCKVWK